MTAEQLQDLLLDILDEQEEPIKCSAITYEDAGVMTHEKGLVLTIDDGSEFQMTLVQSR